MVFSSHSFSNARTPVICSLRLAHSLPKTWPPPREMDKKTHLPAPVSAFDPTMPDTSRTTRRCEMFNESTEVAGPGSWPYTRCTTCLWAVLAQELGRGPSHLVDRRPLGKGHAQPIQTFCQHRGRFEVIRSPGGPANQSGKHHVSTVMACSTA